MYFRCCLIALCMFLSTSYGSQDCGSRVHGYESYSQAGQDVFVTFVSYNLLKKTGPGYYLEIGSGHPIDINNTYSLEKSRSWKGVSLDISSGLKSIWYNDRNNPLMIEDATQSNYQLLLKDFPSEIDYLSLDIDGEYDTVLKKLPFDEHSFKIITIEHDYYRYGDVYRKKERDFLLSHGYYLLCADISYYGNCYEDWWIYPPAFPTEVFEYLKSLNLHQKDCTEALSMLINSCNAHFKR